MSLEKKEKVKSLIREKNVCTLATVFEGEPHCSLMAYISDDDCRNIYMITHKQTKKYRNMIENSLVSLLIDNRDMYPEAGSSGSKALTMIGHCYPLEKSDHTADIRSRFLLRHPNLMNFAAHSDAELIGVRISSVLFLDGLTEAYFEEYR